MQTRGISRAARWIGFFGVLAALCEGRTARAQSFVPGAGQRIEYVGDDFEDENWSYVFNTPKNSSELDGQKRLPDGYSKNRRWFEGPMRGHPDVLERVPTPDGGLAGSQGSLLMRSLYTGTPGRPSRKKQQDDLIVNVRARMGRLIPVSSQPSVVVRVFLPPFDEWEDRSGGTFGLRSGLRGVREKGNGEAEEFWPGMFVHFRSQTDKRNKQDSAYIRIRAGQNGKDIAGPEIKETGWWTLGMSFTPDGQVHYYASPGVDDLQAQDRVASHRPYGFRTQHFETFFFNVMSGDDGRRWSTTWIIDDPSLYLGKQAPVAKKPGNRKR